MTPTTDHRSRTLRRSPAPRAPRRVSGPTRPLRAALAGAGGGTAVARPPLSLRLGRRAMRVGDARVLDRLVRGRAWIAIVAAALIGIVFMQVSMLKLNAGVSRAVTAADTLERQNATLRADISELDSGERVQDAAAKLGMVARAAGDVHYLDAARANAARAAASITPPKPVVPAVQQQAPVAQQQTPVAQQQTQTTQQQPTTQQASATQQQTQATQQQTSATTQQTTATQQQATAQQATSASGQQTSPPATGATAQTGSVAGGATATPGEG